MIQIAKKKHHIVSNHPLHSGGIPHIKTGKLYPTYPNLFGTPYPVGFPFRSNDPDNDNDQDVPGGAGDTDNDAPR